MKNIKINENLTHKVKEAVKTKFPLLIEQVAYRTMKKTIKKVNFSTKKIIFVKKLIKFSIGVSRPRPQSYSCWQVRCAG